MDWENHLEKNQSQKIEKTLKTRSEIATCEQKTTSDKLNFFFKQRFLTLF